MTPEHKKKIAATRASQKATRAAQIITINAKWRIERVDDYNWAIFEKVKGEDGAPYYYGKLIDALLALPHKILNESQMKSLEEILTAVKETAEELTRLRFMKLGGFKDNLSDA